MATDVTRSQYLISKVTINDNNYEIKDAALEAIVKTLGQAAFKDLEAALTDGAEGLATAGVIKSYVDTQVGAINKFDVRIYTELPTASANTMYILGLVQDAQAEAGTYVEYITVRTGADGNYRYEWERIGSTKTDLADYLTKNATVAGVAFGDGKAISAADLKTALGLGALAYKNSATGTVDGQTIKNVKATGNSAGSINVTLKNAAAATNVAVQRADYTPAGSITNGKTTAAGSVALASGEASDQGAIQVSGTVSKPDVTVTPAYATIKQVDSVGSLPSFTEGAFSQGTLPTFTQGDKAAWSASVDSATETLSFSFTANGNDTFTQGTLPSKAADTWNAGSLPALDNGTQVLSGATAALATTPSFTGNYIKADFTGEEAAVSATFKGTTETGLKITSATYLKQEIDDADFVPAAMSLDVGDITVSSKSVTVS